MNAKGRKALDRADRLAQELMDRDWLEQGISQEELEQSRQRIQQMNAALDKGCSMEDVLTEWDSKSIVK